MHLTTSHFHHWLRQPVIPGTSQYMSRAQQDSFVTDVYCSICPDVFRENTKELKRRLDSAIEKISGHPVKLAENFLAQEFPRIFTEWINEMRVPEFISKTLNVNLYINPVTGETSSVLCPALTNLNTDVIPLAMVANWPGFEERWATFYKGAESMQNFLNKK